MNWAFFFVVVVVYQEIMLNVIDRNQRQTKNRLLLMQQVTV